MEWLIISKYRWGQFTQAVSTDVVELPYGLPLDFITLKMEWL